MDVGEGMVDVKIKLLLRETEIEVPLIVCPSSSAHISSTSLCWKDTSRMHPAANSKAPRAKNSPLLKTSFILLLNSSLHSFVAGGCGLFTESKSSGSSNEIRGTSSSMVMSPLLRCSAN